MTKKKITKKHISKDTKRKLTIKQQRFVEWMIETWNATEAVKIAWYKCKWKNVANVIWYENLMKPYIKVQIEERVKNAKAMIYSIAMNWKKEEARIKASQDVIDRVEWKALARTEHSGKLTILSEEELLD